MDKNTSVQELKNILKKIRDDREWAQFHDPKNLAIALSIEANELLELFLWQNKNDVIEKIKNDSEFRNEVSDELADIVNYCLQFANATGIDISTAVKNKVKKVEIKYPIEKAKGVSDKYTKL